MLLDMPKQVWMVRAGRNAVYLEDFLSLQIAAIGWGKIGNLSAVHGRDQIGRLVAKYYPDYNKFQRASSVGQIYRFREDLNPGETVLTYDPGNRLYHVGTTNGDYVYRPDLPEHIQHTREVRWAGNIPRDELTADTKNSLGSISTIFCVSETAAEEILRTVQNGPHLQPEPMVREDIELEAEAEVRKDTEQRALEFLQDRLSKLSWDEMQELVAGLLRGMGYKTRVSPPGPDRGRDIVASPDGFGFQTPRILVEVKHRKGAMEAPEIRGFAGGLRHNDNGLYVSTGGFTREARYEADRANHNIALMDGDDLGTSIVEHYDQMDAESKALLPLKKIYWPT